MFGLHFVKTGLIDSELGKFYSHLFNKRHTGDYDDFVEYSKEESTPKTDDFYKKTYFG